MIKGEALIDTCKSLVIRSGVMRSLISAVFMCCFISGTLAEDGVENYKKKCNEGDLFSCSLLGSLYQWGDGVPYDPPKAIEYHQIACDGGRGYSCLMIGAMYEEGSGVLPNTHEALKYLDLACENKIQVACDKSDKLKNSD